MLQNTAPQPAAVLWDMDGTLVDTEHCWWEAEKHLMARFGIPWTDDDALQYVGAALRDSAAAFRELGVDLEVPEIIDVLIQDVIAQVRQDLTVRPGAVELLLDLRRRGVPTALVTSSTAQLAGVVIEALETRVGSEHGVSGPLFDVRVTGDLDLPGKPDPAPYLFAARRLAQLRPQDGPERGIEAMIAIEDSRTGVRSAVASGALVVGVPNVVPVKGLGVQVERESLEGLDAGALGQLLAQHRPDRAR